VSESNITLNVNPETVCLLIDKVNEFQAKEAVIFPEKIDSSEYEYDPLQILADHRDDLTLLQAHNLIEDLEPDQKADLLALMYVGRGDFEAEEWHRAQKEARTNLSPHLTEYLFGKPQLSEYLTKGLELLGYDYHFQRL